MSLRRRPAGSRASQASSNALLTGCTESPRYQRVFHGERCAVVATSRSPSHLMLATPTQPGTTSRAGKPWSGGSSAPFISSAISTSSSALPTGSGRRTGPWSTPSQTYGSSSPRAMTSTASGRSPARSSTSPSATPRQRAAPMPPSFHGVPSTGVPCWAGEQVTTSAAGALDDRVQAASRQPFEVAVRQRERTSDPEAVHAEAVAIDGDQRRPAVGADEEPLGRERLADRSTRPQDIDDHAQAAVTGWRTTAQKP